MIHGKMYDESTKTYCNTPLEDLIMILAPAPDGTMLTVYSNTVAPLAGQEFCQVCEDASPTPGQQTLDPA